MCKPKNRLLITQTLLSDFGWVFRKEKGYSDFLRTLRREKTPQNQAMLDGIRFEGMVMECAHGNPPEHGHKWEKGVLAVAGDCADGQFQVKLSREITVDGVCFLCYGILDCLKAGHIIDIKCSKTYDVGKYRDSPQHPMYFYLCPEAIDFTYTISDGVWTYRERYTPDISDDIETPIRQFMRWIEKHNLIDLYIKHWQAN